VSVPDLLTALVIAARGGKWEKQSTSDDKWYVDVGNGIQVTFDGFSLDEDDNENRDWESYVVAVDLDGQTASFYVDVEDCLSDNPTANEDYVKERYNDDVEEQLDGSGYSKKKFEKYFSDIVSKLL
jgi:hypothetical protein